MRTNHLQLVTHEHLVTVTERSGVLSPYGPVRVGLTTSPTINDQQLTELLSCLEKKVADLIYKSSTVLDTLVIATQGVRVALSATPIESGGTDV